MEKIQLYHEPMDYGVEEAINTLRTNLLYSGGRKVITVTSTFPGEGKSTTSMQLARSFAELGKMTLFVDCDMRKTEVKERYGITHDTVGLSEFLTGQNSQVVYGTNVPNLSLVLSGKFPPNPTELLSSKRFPILLDTLKKHYEYIILDAPPIGSVIDASILGRYADGILMVVRNDYVNKAEARKAKRQLEQNGGNVIGVVLNRVTTHHKDYYHYKKYYGYAKE